MLPAAVVVALVLCLTAGVGHGATYYVTKGGSHTHTCQQAQSPTMARASIEAGLVCLHSGDTLLIGGGAYAERITNPPSGLSWTQPTTIASMPGQWAVLAPQGAGGPAIDLTVARQYLVFSRLGIHGGQCAVAQNNCGVHLANGAGVKHVRFEHSTVEHIPTCAFRVGVGSDDIQMIGNTIRHLTSHPSEADTGSHCWYWRAVGMTTGRIAGNVCSHYTGNGIQVSYSHDDGTAGVHGLVIENNVFHSDDKAPPGSGITLSSASDGVTVKNNVLYGLHRGLHLAASNNGAVTGNVICFVTAGYCDGAGCTPEVAAANTFGGPTCEDQSLLPPPVVDGPPWGWGPPPDITVPPPPPLPPIVLPPDPDLPTLPPPVQLPPIVLPPPTQPPPYADGGTTPPLPGTMAPT